MNSYEQKYFGNLKSNIYEYIITAKMTKAKVQIFQNCQQIIDVARYIFKCDIYSNIRTKTLVIRNT